MESCSDQPNPISQTHLLLAVLAFVGVTDLCIILDIPVLRQVAGFFLLALVPGLLILLALRVERLDWVTYLLLAVGISIVFLLAYGLFLNELLLIVGFDAPMTQGPILVGLNLFVLFMVVVHHLRSGGRSYRLSLPRFRTFETNALLPALLLPFAGIAGVAWINLGGGSVPLLVFYLALMGYVGFAALQYRRISGDAYAVILLFTGLSLTLLLAFRSNHLIGTDTHFEFYTFMNTLSAGYWADFDKSLLDACLSISIFPTIFQTVLGVPPEPLFKVLYPVLFSCSPLVVYQISRQYVEDHFAFLAGFFFISQLFFIWVTSNARTSVAVLFFMLAFLVLFEQRIPNATRYLLAGAFLVGIVLSHYSTSYIIFGVLLITYVSVSALVSRTRQQPVIRPVLLLIMIVAILFWYGVATVEPLAIAGDFIDSTVNSIASILTEQLQRGEDVQSAFGLGIGEKGAAHIVQFFATWITLGCIAIGLLYPARHLGSRLLGRGESVPPAYLKRNFEANYMVFALCGASLICVMVVVPFLSRGYEIARVYPLSLTPLSVFFVIGGIVLANTVSALSSRIMARRAGSPTGSGGMLMEIFRPPAASWERTARLAVIVIVLILVPYFLSTVGAVHNLLGTPREITLNNFGQQYEDKYITDSDVGAAQWLRNHSPADTLLYADSHGASPLMSHGDASAFRTLWFDKNPPLIRGIALIREPNWKDGVVDLLLHGWFTTDPNPPEYRRVIARVYTNGQVDLYTMP